MAMDKRSEPACDLWDAYVGDMSTITDPAKVLVVGLMNTGKSTLLNALLDTPEQFATADARTTTVEQSAILRPIRLIDTPGLDVREQDDEVTHRAMQDADLVLYVHSAAQGDLEAAEVEFLKTVARVFPDAATRAQRLLPLLSKVDRIQLEEDRAHVIQAIEAQWVKYLDAPPKELLEVSGLRYLKALPDKRPRLMNLSGIPRLRDRLVQHSAKLGQSRARLCRDRARNNLSELLSMVQHARATMKARADDRKQRAKAERKRLNQRIEETMQAIDALGAE